ncbi:MAG: excisionase family DNA-binding protein [Cellulomonas sp.]|uniref:helix-turn-helix domain-containing protein n=1 Tax=Cellulomonas sp. TaxID=40001 RepID=UPI002585C71E|nr:helix-turn-helix domain-containing protein [Cellulomonas sp.]MCR6703170.1 excisionase family DNA-binding protein [Cellulomonas sp.]
MTTSYNARVDLDRPAPAGHDDEWTDHVLAELAGHSAAVSRALDGRTTIDLTLPADSLRQAVTTALALVTHATGAEPVGLEVITTESFDRRHGAEPVGRLLSVTEAANALGVSRQAVLQRIESGSLPASRVGNAWALPASAVCPPERPDDAITYLRDRYPDAEISLERRSCDHCGWEVHTMAVGRRGREEFTACTRDAQLAQGNVVPS